MISGYFLINNNNKALYGKLHKLLRNGPEAKSRKANKKGSEKAESNFRL
jgi:hypothetical protein